MSSDTDLRLIRSLMGTRETQVSLDPDSQVVLSGKLFHKSRAMLGSNEFKKKDVMLGHKYLTYHREKDESGVTFKVQNIDLTFATVNMVNEGAYKRLFCFEVHSTESSRPYVFSCLSESSVTLWVSHIKEVIDRLERATRISRELGVKASSKRRLSVLSSIKSFFGDRSIGSPVLFHLLFTIYSYDNLNKHHRESAEETDVLFDLNLICNKASKQMCTSSPCVARAVTQFHYENIDSCKIRIEMIKDDLLQPVHRSPLLVLELSLSDMIKAAGNKSFFECRTDNEHDVPPRLNMQNPELYEMAIHGKSSSRHNPISGDVKNDSTVDPELAKMAELSVSKLALKGSLRKSRDKRDARPRTVSFGAPTEHKIPSCETNVESYDMPVGADFESEMDPPVKPPLPSLTAAQATISSAPISPFKELESLDPPAPLRLDSNRSDFSDTESDVSNYSSRPFRSRTIENNLQSQKSNDFSQIRAVSCGPVPVSRRPKLSLSGKEVDHTYYTIPFNDNGKRSFSFKHIAREESSYDSDSSQSSGSFVRTGEYIAPIKDEAKPRVNLLCDYFTLFPDPMIENVKPKREARRVAHENEEPNYIPYERKSRVQTCTCGNVTCAICKLKTEDKSKKENATPRTSFNACYIQ